MLPLPWRRRRRVPSFRSGPAPSPVPSESRRSPRLTSPTDGGGGRWFLPLPPAGEARSCRRRRSGEGGGLLVGTRGSAPLPAAAAVRCSPPRGGLFSFCCGPLRPRCARPPPPPSAGEDVRGFAYLYVLSRLCRGGGSRRRREAEGAVVSSPGGGRGEGAAGPVGEGSAPLPPPAAAVLSPRGGLRRNPGWESCHWGRSGLTSLSTCSTSFTPTSHLPGPQAGLKERGN